MRAFNKLKFELIQNKEGDAINNLSDLLRSIANGDNGALTELYNVMSKEIYVFLLMLCKNKYTAEDVLQDTFIAVCENAGSYRGYNNPRAWIFTIAKNKAVNVIKKDSRTTSIDSTETAALYTDENVENIILDKMRVDSLLSILPDEDKKIVILHTVYGFKHREIAEILSLPPGTVRWRYKQSIEKMKQKDRTDKDNGEVFSELNKQNEVTVSEKQKYKA